MNITCTYKMTLKIMITQYDLNRFISFACSSWIFCSLLVLQPSCRPTLSCLTSSLFFGYTEPVPRPPPPPRYHPICIICVISASKSPFSPGVYHSYMLKSFHSFQIIHNVDCLPEITSKFPSQLNLGSVCLFLFFYSSD